MKCLLKRKYKFNIKSNTLDVTSQHNLHINLNSQPHQKENTNSGTVNHSGKNSNVTKCQCLQEHHECIPARNHIQTLFPTTRYAKPTPPRRPRGILYKISNIHWHFINLSTVVLLNVSQDLDVITLHKIYCNTLQTMIGPITSSNIYIII